jgi:uncharacterized protein
MNSKTPKTFVGIIFLGIFILVSLVFGIIFSFNTRIFYKKPDSKKSLMFSKLELADDEQEREKGLMNRENLCADCGMLFVFKDQSIRTFWMKNTYISLDIIFLDKTGKIVKIHNKTKPFQTSEVYSSIFPSQYVLEVNAGFSKNNDLKVSDDLDIPELKKQSIDFENS